MALPQELLHVGMSVRQATILTDVIYRVVDTQVLVSSNTETTIATYTIPANQLDIDRLFRFRIYGALFNNTGVNNGVTFRAKFNGTTYVTDATLNAIGTSAANYTAAFLEYNILQAGDNANQNIYYKNESATTPLGTAAASRSTTVGANIAAISTTSDRVALITAQLSANNANLSWTTSNVYAEFY